MREFTYYCVYQETITPTHFRWDHKLCLVCPGSSKQTTQLKLQLYTGIASSTRNLLRSALFSRSTVGNRWTPRRARASALRVVHGGAPSYKSGGSR